MLDGDTVYSLRHETKKRMQKQDRAAEYNSKMKTHNTIEKVPIRN